MFDRKIHDKKYRESKKGRIADKKGQAKYRKTEKCKAKHQRYRQTEKYKVIQHKFWQSSKGRQAKKRMKAKRCRNLGFIPMFKNPFDDSELVEYHHITNAYVVAIPKDLHQLYKTKNHRENTMEIVKQIYLRGD